MSRTGFGVVLLVVGLARPTVWLLGKVDDGDGAGIANVIALPLAAPSVVVGVIALRAPRPSAPPVLPGRAYRIVAKHSRKVLDVESWATTNFTPIIQYDWHGGANQRWLIIPA